MAAATPLTTMNTSTMRMLEEQGYTLELSAVTGALPEETARGLLQTLQDLCQDKQEFSVSMNRTRELTSKLGAELEMQRKQNASLVLPFYL